MIPEKQTDVKCAALIYSALRIAGFPLNPGGALCGIFAARKG